MVTTGISTASFFDTLMLEDAPALFRQWGVKNAEYYLNSWCEYDPAFVDRLAKETEDAGIRVVGVHPMSLQYEPLLFTPHPRQRSDAMKAYELVLRAGERLHADHYVMHGPVVLNGVAKNLQLTRLAPIFDTLSDMAEDHGLHLTLENVSFETQRPAVTSGQLRLTAKDTIVAQLLGSAGVKATFNRTLSFEPDGPFTVSVSFSVMLVFNPGTRGEIDWKTIDLAEEFKKNCPQLVQTMMTKSALLIAEITNANGTPILPMAGR